MWWRRGTVWLGTGTRSRTDVWSVSLLPLMRTLPSHLYYRGSLTVPEAKSQRRETGRNDSQRSIIPCVINIRNSWIKTQSILSINPWLPKRRCINVMSLAKWFLDPFYLHFITPVLLQESTAAVHSTTTVMPVLNQQTEIDVKAGTPEKTFANVKLV